MTEPIAEILLAGPRGFCAGVERAIDIVELALSVCRPPVYVRREIVAPPLRGAPPCGWLLKVRGLALLDALPRLPGQWASGRRDRRRARESRPFPDC